MKRCLHPLGLKVHILHYPFYLTSFLFSSLIYLSIHRQDTTIRQEDISISMNPKALLSIAEFLVMLII